MKASKKYIFFFSLASFFIFNTVFLYGQQIDANIVTIGAAIYNSSTGVLCITPDSANVNGGAIYEKITGDSMSGFVTSTLKLNLEVGFFIEASIKFGTKDDLGGEGLVIVLAKDYGQIIPMGIGGYLGYEDVPNSIGLVFDTNYQPEFPFFNTMEGDNFSLRKNSILSAPIFGPVSILHPVNPEYPDLLQTNVENGEKVDLRFQWDPQEQLLEVFINGRQRMAYQEDLIAFFGQNKIDIGVVGSTGDVFNKQEISILAWEEEEDPREISGCIGTSEVNKIRDLKNWIIVNNPDYGVWKEVTNHIQYMNGGPTMLASPISFIEVEMEGKIKVLNGADDDHIGICWGLQQPFAQSHDTYKGWLLDCKMKEQWTCDSTTYSPEGIALTYMDDYLLADCATASEYYFWNHDDSFSGFQLLDTVWGAGTGWEVNKTYTFRVRYTTNAFDVYILDENDTVIYENHQGGLFHPGRFAFYNHSQPDVKYSNFTYTWLSDFMVDKDTICAGDSIRMSYAISNSLLPTVVDDIYWVIDDTDTINAVVNDMIPAIDYQFLEPGEHSITLYIVDASNCEQSSTKTVFVNPLPVVDLGVDTMLCPGQVLYLAPPFAGAEIIWQGSVAFPTWIASTVGNYMVTVGYGGCIGRDTIHIAYADSIQYNTVVDNSCFSRDNGFIDIELIAGMEVTAQLNGEIGWTHHDLVPGVHHLELKDAIGCSQEEDIMIDEACEPLFTIEVDSVSCYEENDGRIVLQANDCPILFSIEGEDSLDHIIIDELYAEGYDLVYTDSLGCEWNRVITVDSPPPLEVYTYPEDTTVIIGQCIELLSELSFGQVIKVLWTPAVGLNRIDSVSVLASPTDDQQYCVSLENEKGCQTKGFVNVNIDKNKGLFIPNVFSPNGDGVNDILFPYAGKVAKGVRLIKYFYIFGKGGGLTFVQKNFPPDTPSMGWDGYLKGKPQNQGVYVYMIEWERVDGLVFFAKGDITLIR